MIDRQKEKPQTPTATPHEPSSHQHAAMAAAQEPQGDAHVVTCLAECGDTLRIGELAQVLGISIGTIEQQERDGTFPIPRVGGLGAGRKYRRRIYAKADVVRFLEQGGHLVFRARRHSRRIA